MLNILEYIPKEMQVLTNRVFVKNLGKLKLLTTVVGTNKRTKCTRFET